MARRVEGGRVVTLTAGDLARRVATTAAELVRAGLKRGDPVVIHQPDDFSWLAADLAVLSAGGVVVGVNRAAPAWEVEAILRRLHPSLGLGPVPGVPVHLEPAEAGDPGDLAQWRNRLEALRPEEPAAISFTSGSTGEPLPVLLSHENLAWFPRAFPAALEHRRDDSYLSYLPLHRVGSRLDFYLGLLRGLPFGLPDGRRPPRKNIRALGATMLWNTPLFFINLHRRVTRGRPPAGLGRVVAAGRMGLWKSTLRLAFSCGAPLPAQVERDLRDLGLPVLSFYGMTEATGGISANLPGAWKDGTVGRPLPGLEVRLAEDGEVLLRGPSVMQGYLGEPDLTRETLAEGWLHTGDLGELDPEGYLRLVGRKKEILVLSSGRNVVPGPLEALLATLPGVKRALVVGEGRSEAAALVVPSDEVRDRTAFLESLPGLAAPVLERRPRQEQVRAFALLPRDLSEAEGELTSWGKVRRPAVLEHFRDAVEEAYRGLPPG